MKKVLFVTYYWPPAGGAPINRILKFYKFLPEFGWEPVILTVDKGDFPFIDQSLVSQVHEQTPVYKAKNFSIHQIFKRISPKSKNEFIPYGFTDHTSKGFIGKMSRWVKYNFIPDTRILWKRSAYRKTKDIFSEHKIDLVFSSSPPQTNHIIARKIARKYNIPWVADFRDPWTDVFWLNNNSKRLGLIHRIDKSIERKTIQSMDAIVTVSPSLVSLLSLKTKKKIDLIYNGFDEDMIPPQKSIPKNDKFTVTYAGSMSFEQNPVSFFKCIEQLSRNESFAQGCRLRFIGNFPPFLHEMIRNSPLSHCFELTEYTDHQKAIEYIASSDLLLMIVPQTPDNKCVVTSKVFDYLAVKVPILAYGPIDGDAASIIKQADAGEIFDYNDVDNSWKYLLNQFQNHVGGKPLLCSKDEYIRSFSRRNLTAQLAEIFHSLTKT